MPCISFFHDGGAQLEFTAFEVDLLFNDRLNVDVFIKVNKAVPFADSTSICDDFHFLHGSKPHEEFAHFIFILLNINSTNKNGIRRQLAFRQNVSI